MSDEATRGKGQSHRLQDQHELAGGPAGIFGNEAKKHDNSVEAAAEIIFEQLKNKYKRLKFRHRRDISKAEINRKLAPINQDFGQTLFVQRSNVNPDGGIIEVQDIHENFRIVLVSESKH